jgi:HK97 family phage major capsid protein
VVSTAIKEKTEKLERVRVRARTIMAEFEGKTMPAEQSLAIKTLIEEGQKLQGEIAEETKLADQRRDLEDLDRFLDAPERKLPHGVNPDDESKRMLDRAGWETKGGMVYAGHSLEGKTVTLADGRRETMGKIPMYPADVLFGPLPTDDVEASAFYKRARAIHAPEYKAAYSHYLQLCTRLRSESMAYSMLSGTEQKALSEGTDTSGGFVVPPDIMAEVLARTPQKAVMRAMCRVQPTNRDMLRYPAVAANAGTYNGISGGSVYASGFVGSWVGETPAFSDTDPAFQTLDIQVKKVRVATRLSNDFINDAAVNVLSWLAQNGAENMALTEDAGFINGLGSALQPLGLLNVPGITTVNVAGTTSHAISNTTSNLGSATPLIQMAYKLPAQYVAAARWLMARVTEGEIRQLVDGSGRFLWPPFVGSAFAGLNPTGYNAELLGFPLMHSDWVPLDGTANNNVCVLGDFAHYVIAQRTEITTVVLRERFADTDQTGIILFERVGGGCWNTDAFRIGYVS